MGVGRFTYDEGIAMSLGRQPVLPFDEGASGVVAVGRRKRGDAGYVRILSRPTDEREVRQAEASQQDRAVPQLGHRQRRGEDRQVE